MGHWIIDDNNILESDTHGNMRQYRHTETGQVWLVRVEIYYDFENNKQCVEVYVDGECVSSRLWDLYHAGKMHSWELPYGWGLSNGFDIGWRNVQKQVKASA